MSSDSVLKTFYAQPINPQQMLKATQVSPANQLNAIYSLTQLLHGATFIAGSLNIRTLLKCDVDHMRDADRSLREKLSKWIISYDRADMKI